MSDDMDALIERALRGEAGPAELERLERWRAASPENERQHARTVRLLASAALLGEAESAAPAPASTGITGSAGRAGRATRATRTSRAARAAAGGGATRSRAAGWLPWGIAAAAVLALVLLRTPGPAAPAPATVVTGPAELATVELADGSVVRVAPSSRLRLLPSPDGRRVALEGRAFFDVAARPDSRFQVRTAVGDAVVLGTKFELAADAERLELVVVEGRVALSAGGRDVAVEGGQVGGIVRGGLLEPRRLAPGDRRLATAGRFLVFRATPLGEAVARVEAAYDVRVEIADPALAARTVTATFVDRTAEEVLEVLCSIGDVRCRTEGGATVITR